MKVVKQHKCFSGKVQFWKHQSLQTKTEMSFSTFIPEGKLRGCLIWLSGLTCTEETFMAKAGAAEHLARAGLMVLCPDTSPRGLNLKEEHDSWDFGSGAGFYVDATTAGYRDHYRMYSYVTGELYDWLLANYPLKDRISIFGHSMGGHGALVMGLREPELFQSVSAFAPIVHPSQCPWGEKAFLGYLGEDKNTWSAYDACELLKAGQVHKNPLWIDQGTEDAFLKEQLLTPHIEQAAKGSSQKLKVRYLEGYDHSYYFISTFIGEHIRFHAEHLSS